MIHLIAFFKSDSETYAYHYESKEYSDIKLERKLLKQVIEENALSLSIHVIKDSVSGFEGIQKIDSYFEDMKLVNTKQELVTLFIKKIRLDKYDVAGYVEQKFKLKAFALQKVLYYIYAESLVKLGEPLFSANFLAYARGPVDVDIYRIKKYEDSLTRTKFDKKMLLNKEGTKLVKEIDDLTKVVGTYFEEVVTKKQWENRDYNYTHRDNTPWQRAYKKGQNTPIKDKDIIKYHKNEKIGVLAEL